MMSKADLRYSEAELRFFGQLRDYGYAPDVVYDIGGSNGMWSHLANTVFPKAQYHLFEPLADHLESYKTSLADVLGKNSNFALHKIGLGDQNRVQDMAIFGKGFGSTFLETERIKASEDALKASGHLEQMARFPVRKLDDYVAEQKLPLPQIIKMDTQGFEVAIVEGGQATVKAADILVLETWLYRGYGVTTPLLHELMDRVGALGFVLVDFGDIYWAHKHKLTSIDAFFMREDFLDKIENTTNKWNWRIWK
jgi:FkbM family methyltransferase